MNGSSVNRPPFNDQALVFGVTGVAGDSDQTSVVGDIETLSVSGQILAREQEFWF